MSQEKTSTTSRRAFLTAAAATMTGGVVATIPVVATAETHPDADLLRMAREHATALDYADSLRDASDDEVNDACGAIWDIQEVAVDTPARTPQGLLAKARMFEDGIRGQLSGSGADEFAFDSLMADLEAIAAS